VFNVILERKIPLKFFKEKVENKILIHVIFVYMAWAVAYSILRVLAEPSFLSKLTDPRFLYFINLFLGLPGRQSHYENHEKRTVIAIAGGHPAIKAVDNT
jgi:hypothetical protein